MDADIHRKWPSKSSHADRRWSMDNITTSLALRLIPLAQELEDGLSTNVCWITPAALLHRTKSEASSFEALKIVDAEIDSYLRLAEDVESIEDAKHSPPPCITTSRSTSQPAARRSLSDRSTRLRLRQSLDDKEGLTGWYC